jgi:hypothetical protein
MALDELKTEERNGKIIKETPTHQSFRAVYKDGKLLHFFESEGATLTVNELVASPDAGEVLNALPNNLEGGPAQFEVGVAVEVGDLITDDGEYYEVIQAHTTQADWRPANVPALFRHIAKIPEGQDYPNWVQPTGAHDAYKLGDIVMYDSEHAQVWISKIDANVTVPDGDWPFNRYWEPYTE